MKFLSEGSCNNWIILIRKNSCWKKLNYLETKNKIQKSVPSDKGCFALALIKIEGVSVCMCVCLCVCVCTRACFCECTCVRFASFIIPLSRVLDELFMVWMQNRPNWIYRSHAIISSCLTEEISPNFEALSANTVSL